MSERFLAFEFGSRLWGVPMAHARELLPFPVLTPVPHAPDWLLGACQIRGDMLSVISLHPFVGCPPPKAAQHNRLLVLDDSHWVVAIPVSTAYSFEASTEEWAPHPLHQKFPVVSSELLLEARQLGLIDLTQLRQQITQHLDYHPEPAAPHTHAA